MSKKNPAEVFGFRNSIVGWGGVSTGLSFYAKFVKGYSVIYLFTPYIPSWLYSLYSYRKQPQLQKQNIYRYLLAKRAATAQLSETVVAEDAYPLVTKYLKERQTSLYELDARITQ